MGTDVADAPPREVRPRTAALVRGERLLSAVAASVQSMHLGSMRSMVSARSVMVCGPSPSRLRHGLVSPAAR
ncbi:hypothetical protein AWN90_28455 [Nocardia terpenica]|uniref:Uncharacterized protein n=1 Tax=Nocardia terpenica TaxID=455432 RepID=A0A164LSX8_9NOCA|nr:hypothetical protein AWN90_28455 [Nocardia terpenica]